MFRARPVVAVMLALGLTFFAQDALAQDTVPDRVDVAPLDFTPVLVNASAGPLARFAHINEMQIPMAPIVAQRPRIGGGSALLSSLYASTVVMQGLDLHSTLKAFGAGAVEGNPLMAGITRNRAAFIVTKAAVAAVTILASRKLAKKHKIAAVVTLIVVNGAYAMIASHNYGLARGR